MKAYKVVSVDHKGNMTSFVRHIENGGVRYAMGETTNRPEGQGPLATFKNYIRAIEWARVMGSYFNKTRAFFNMAILECDVGVSQDNGLWVNKYFVSTMFPCDTILCDSVTPVKVMYEYKEKEKERDSL